MKKSLIPFTLCTSLLCAQQGNQDGHDNMNPVVPAEFVPPAPVLSVEEALKSFQIADGFIIEHVAAEPLVDRPVDLRFDGNGRMWVVEMIGYMPDLDGTGEEEPSGRIVVLEDKDNDGKADKRTVFLDQLVLPRAIALVKDGLLIGDQQRLWFCGRRGIERTSEPIVVDEDFAPTGNVEHKTNTLLPHLNNWLYCAKSDVRYRWQDGKLQKDNTLFRGQWGLTMDDFGRLYHNQNSTFLIGERLLPETLKNYPAANLSANCSIDFGNNRTFPIRVTPGVNRAYIAKSNGYDEDILDPKTYKLINTTSSAGLTIYRGDQFPDEWKGVALTCESVANLVKAIRVKATGVHLTGEHVFRDTEFLASTDERFRPVNIHTAPDGSLYLVDFYHGIIQHKTYMTSYLRKQYEERGLDKPASGLGRLYRIRHQGMALGPRPKLEEATSDELLKALAHSNGWWRDTAQRLLIEKNEAGIAEKLKNELHNHPDEIARIHILWTLEGLGALDDNDLLAASENSGTQLSAHLLNLASLSPTSFSANTQRNLLAKLGATEENATYAIRLEASTKTSEGSTYGHYYLQHAKAPYAAEAAASGLLSQQITTVPKTKTKLDQYLANFSKHREALPPEKRLTGEHLASFQRGKNLFSTKAACIACHGADGAGMPNLGPPLNKSEWVTGPIERLAKILLHGLQGEITVNGVHYKPLAEMPGLAQNPTISDEDLADIMTYVRSEWDNTAGPVTPQEVKEIREATKERIGRVYSPAEL